MYVRSIRFHFKANLFIHRWYISEWNEILLRYYRSLFHCFILLENHRFESNLRCFTSSPKRRSLLHLSNNVLASRKIHYKNLFIQTFSTARLFSQHASSISIRRSKIPPPSNLIFRGAENRDRRQTKQKLHSLEGIEARETFYELGKSNGLSGAGVNFVWWTAALSRTKQRCVHAERGGEERVEGGGRRQCTWRVGLVESRRK